MTEQELVQPISSHRQHKRALMVARILDTAREIMRTEGVAALSMQELARRLGLRAPSLYHYFANKMDLYDTLFRLGFTLFGEQLAGIRQGALTWQEELQQYFEVYLKFAQQNPELYQLCFERPVPGFTPSEKSLQLSTGMLQQEYRRAQKLLPQLDSGLDERQFVDLIIAIIHGLTALHIANEPHLAAGAGRFGGLIPIVMSVLEKAWGKQAL